MTPTLEYPNVENICTKTVYSFVHNCKKCPYVTKSLFSITHHVKSHHSKSKLLFDCSTSTPEMFSCKECNFKTNETITFINHVRSHTLQTQKIFSWNSVSQGHGELETEKNYTQSGHFNSKFKTRCLLQMFAVSQKQYVMSGTNTLEKIKQSNCFGYSYKNNSYKLTIHMIKQTASENIKWYHCFAHSSKKCSYFTKSWFLITNHVKHHERSHNMFDCSKSTPEIFSCQECNFKTYETVTFNNHIKDHTITSPQSPTNQEYDQPEYVLTDSLTNHVKRETPDDTKWFHCDQCPYKTKWKGLVKRHVIDRHTPLEEINWFKCDACSFKAKQKNDLKRHINSKHTAPSHIKWFHCDTCPYKAKRKEYLKNHILVHYPFGPEEELQCDHCAYTTKQKSLLRTHVYLKHTAPESIKWIECDKCSYKCKRKTNLRTHMAVKHGAVGEIKWFYCDRCSYKAKQKGSVKRHVLSRHTKFEQVFV